MKKIFASRSAFLLSNLLSLLQSFSKTKALNRQVRRNLARFPNDFMFELTKEEFEFLKCQNGTSKTGRGGKQKQPLVFTELGIAMLSSVLRSKRAVLVNISIMRIFIKLRSFLLLEQENSKRLDKLESSTNQLFQIVFKRLDSLGKTVPAYPKERKKIGLKGQ